MQFSVVKGRVDFLPGAIIERKFHSAYSIHVSFLSAAHRRLKGRGIAHIFPTLIAVIVALRHLGVAERARLQHRHSFPHAWAGLCLLICWHVTLWRISSEALS